MATIQDQEQKSQISDQLDHMENHLSQLGKSIDGLKADLQSVLREPISTKESSPEDEESLVDLINSIRDGAHRIRVTTSDIVWTCKKLHQ